MPELPDIELYLHALRPRIGGQRLDAAIITSPFLLRSVEPRLEDAVGARVVALRRLGKRIVWQFDNDLFLVIHLMIAGRFRWKPRGDTSEAASTNLRRKEAGRAGKAGGAENVGSRLTRPAKTALASFEFATGALMLTEAGSQRRASIHVVRGEDGLAALDPGGIDVMAATRDEFGRALTQDNHTLKRALTDPHLLSGIGNAYSDEILHAARLSPLQLTSRLSAEDITRLHAATVGTLTEWRERLLEDAGDRFPEKVTAFRDGMAAHGRFGQPCPVCGAPIQRIRYAANEANYCAVCQTGGKLLADRAMSRLLRQDWPRSLDELERHKAQRRG